jgi:large subunit ribosomal protein L7/L12
MTSEKVQKIVDLIKELNVVEAFELKKALEETFDIQPMAAVPFVAGTNVNPSAESTATQAEEKTEFDVILISAGDNKIEVIKTVRAITGLGLKEAKDLVDAVASGNQKAIKEGIKKEEAAKIKSDIEAAGGKVEIK